MTALFDVKALLKAIAIHTQRNRKVEIAFTKQGHLVIYSSNEKGEKIRTIVPPDELRDTEIMHDFIGQAMSQDIHVRTSKMSLGGFKKLLRLGG